MNKNNVVFVTNNQPRTTISSSGNVGIGTSAPSTRFEIFKEKEPLTEWYKAGVKAKGLKPHIADNDDGSET